MFNKYPYTNFNEYNLDWIIERVKTLTEDWLSTKEEWDDTKEEWDELYTYVHDYFDNLDVSQEVGQIIDEYRRDGTLTTICQPIVDHWVETYVPRQIEEWLTANITQETGYVLDSSLTLSNAAAPAKTVGDALTDVNNALELLELGKCEYDLEWESGDLSNVGAEIADDNYRRTDFIPADYLNGKTYTLNTTMYLYMFFYDAEKAFLSKTANNVSGTFEIPSVIKYARLVVRTDKKDYLDIQPIIINTEITDDILSKINETQMIEYSINDNILSVKSPYGDEDITIEFGKRGVNNLPDFRYITIGSDVKYGNFTDWFSPFKVRAVNNANGDDPTNDTFTGGNHNYNNTGDISGTATARNISLEYYAYGKPITENGYANEIKIVWVNRVQAYNTRKIDGSGREVLEERHTLLFDGKEWEAYTEIEPLEDVVIETYYGFQCYIANYGTVYMIGADYRQPFNYETPHPSGNAYPNIYVAHDSSDRLEMEVDRTLDLGRGSLYSQDRTQGFITSGSKGYCYVIYNGTISANSIYGLRGWYRFIPQF